MNKSLDPILIESSPENSPPNSTTSKLPHYNVQNIKQESEVITIIDDSPEKSINKPLLKKPKLELNIKGEDEIEGPGDKKEMFIGIEEIFDSRHRIPRYQRREIQSHQCN